MEKKNVSHSIGSTTRRRRRKADGLYEDEDYIWMEILCRLPSAKSAVRCKCVSKHWNSLISHKKFVTRFIEHHREKNYGANFDPDQLLWFLTYSSIKEGTRITSGSCLLPRTSYRVESSFNDLLLCSDHKMKTARRPLVYYIFNPFTKEQIELPVCQPDPMYHSRQVGFVCEPFYGANASYRYRVVFIEYHSRIWNADCILVTYCSETRQWSVQTGLKYTDYLSVANILGHNGKLYWYTRKKVVAYDPFVTPTEPCFYHFDRKGSITMPAARFHVVEGSVVLVEMGMDRVQCEVLVSKLKENGHGDHGEWRLERRIVLHKLFKSVGAPSFLNQVRCIARDHKKAYTTLLFCFHPSNRDVILLTDSTSFNTASYNLGTKEWQVVGELVPFIDPGTHPTYDGGVLVTNSARHITATLPWWPTPVH